MTSVNKQLEAAAAQAQFAKDAYAEAQQFGWQDFSYIVNREFAKISDIDPAVLPADQYDRELGKQWLLDYDVRNSDILAAYNFASWIYNTNITSYNQQRMLEAAAAQAQFAKDAYAEAQQFAWQDFSYIVNREFAKISDIGPAVLPPADYDRMSSLGADMETMYSTAKVCRRPGFDPSLCYPLDPDLSEILATSRDWNELLWAWDGWRNESSPGMAPLYQEFVTIQNQAALMNGYADNGAYWRSWYEDPTLESEVARLWEELKPFYQQLHAYARRRLQSQYPGQNFPATGHIPAHLFGNMWSQQWNNIEDILVAYPDKPILDVTDEMIRQGYNVTYMFQLSEQFFTSLGLIPMTPSFWTDSMIVRPSDGREVVCHASAWDFYNAIDFRIKQCTEVSMEWLMTTHHEMGHIEYFLQYKGLPTEFRDGANPGFHEAIGDVMELSVSTPEHLQLLGLLPGFQDDPETDINFLLSMSLKKLAFLPFGYLIDQWRWAMYRGEITPENYNSAWWNLRCQLQGMSPPTSRFDGVHFDPGAKYHVPANVPYIRYFVSHILQFQFQKALCDAAGYTGPLHRCDVYGSLAAGQVFADMMSTGSSEPWPDVLERVTGSRQMSAAAFNEYFAPLRSFLEAENAGQPVGWDETQCPNNFKRK